MQKPEALTTLGRELQHFNIGLFIRGLTPAQGGQLSPAESGQVIRRMHTGEKQLLDPSFPISGTRTSKDVIRTALRIAPPFISRSAEMFWEVLVPFHNQFIAWDVFPLHSHKSDNPFTVRNPTNKETDQFGEAVRIIVSFMNPKIIISVGRKAFDELNRLGINSLYVRHPSRGGQRKFIDGIQSVFSGQAIG